MTYVDCERVVMCSAVVINISTCVRLIPYSTSTLSLSIFVNRLTATVTTASAGPQKLTFVGNSWSSISYRLYVLPVTQLSLLHAADLHKTASR